MTRLTEPPVPEMAECMIAIFRGEVRCAVAMKGNPTWRDAVAEWSADPRVSEIVRVPVEVARQFLFKRWPGRDAAIAQSMAAAVEPTRRALQQEEGTR